MVQFLRPYAIDLGGVRCVGAYGGEFADVVAAEVGELFGPLDGLLRERGSALTGRDVLRQLLCGEAQQVDLGACYGYALHLLCEYGGCALSGWAVRAGWSDAVRDGLAAVGVDFDPMLLVGSGAPVELPPYDGPPRIGSLTRGEISALSNEFAGLRSARLRDRQIAEAVDELLDWLQICLDRDLDLMCFLL